MSIVSHRASKANRLRSESLTTHTQASVNVIDRLPDRSTAPRTALWSSIQTLTETQSPSVPREYVIGYSQLSKHGVGFYPIHMDKSPAVKGKLEREITTDPIKIRFWAEYRYHTGFALRIPRDSRLMVIDTENPFKHPDKPGPDGELVLYGLLEEHAITLPPSPMVQTASEGFHRYFQVPKGLRIRSAIGLWPGIDILAAGSSVVLPGSRTEAGSYRMLRSFDECPIPEAPRDFIKLIRKAQKTKPGSDQSNQKCGSPLPGGDNSIVSRRQWWLLFHNRVFRSFWDRQGKAADTSDSAYEFHLAKACFCCGLNERQTSHVTLVWRQEHGLDRVPRKLSCVIIPAAWREVSPWVERWRTDRAAAEKAKQLTKTSTMILSYIIDSGQPQTPASIASALPIPRERAKKALQRMAKGGQLQRTKSGYTVL
jgi:Bifunctional DNA primase/polymerase, N-terminal